MITLLSLLIASVIYMCALMIDFMLLLVCIRSINMQWPVVILVEFDQAGRPLIDRTLSVVKCIWQRFVPSRRLRVKQTLLIAAIALCLVRLILAGMLSLMSA